MIRPINIECLIHRNVLFQVKEKLSRALVEQRSMLKLHLCILQQCLHVAPLEHSSGKRFQNIASVLDCQNLHS